MTSQSRLAISSAKKTVPIHFVEPGGLRRLTDDLPANAVQWAKTNGFGSGNGGALCVPDEKGKVACVLFSMAENANPLDAGKLAGQLPEGDYHYAEPGANAHLKTLGFLLGAYAFTRYRKNIGRHVRLAVPDGIDREALEREAESVFLTRDLINTPTNDMLPGDLEDAVRALGQQYKATVSAIRGDDLLKKNFPMIHAVGRASTEAPRLVDLKWGKASDPKVTLVGKGVCFDTGGLNIKPGSSMALMKKDMGGAANVLGLARMIMAANLPVRLRVLVPAVENAIAGNAFRPGDILPSRKGITVEIGNTDAEGRLILGDALALACEEKPEIVIDMATLTGAARVALGQDLPPFFTDDEKLAAQIASASGGEYDPLWRMPLWKPYEGQLASKVADTNHITSGGLAGAITAALFLKKFVDPGISWVHLDVYGWVQNARPWAAVGGEAQGIRALYSVLKSRYAGKQG